MMNSELSQRDKLRAAALLELRKRSSQPQNLVRYDNGFKALPWAQEFMEDRSPIILLTGSAGGGKSRHGLEKLNNYMQQYPGVPGLMMRKAREWTNKSIVPFMKQTVMKGNPNVDIKKSDSRFEYKNGSTLFWGGMKDDDQRESMRSIGGDGGLGIALFEEANAFTEDDLNETLARMRSPAAPYRQLILQTNPDAPNHWINQRLIIGGQAKVYYSSAKDNPYNPPEYAEFLNSLTGILYERLVLGKWVQAEGVIYDNFTIDGNVSEEAEYNPAWPVAWFADDGYAAGAGKGSASYHPRVVLLCQFTPQGGVNVFYEYVKTNELSEKTISNILELPYPKPNIAYVDSSAAELRGRIWQTEIQTVSATHPVSEGIKNVRRLVCDGNGVRLLKIHSRCTETINEMQSYRYDINSHLVQAGEPKPLKENDHCLDSLRYGCFSLRYS